MLKQIQRPFNVFLLLILVSLLGYGFNIANNGSETSKKGSFHIHQSIHNEWEEMFVEPYSVTYQTKSFQLTPQDNTVKIRINQQTVSYGDIEFVHLQACNQNVSPDYARYTQSGESVLDDILLDDHNVAINHENPIEILWTIPSECHESVTLTMKANEYESPEENAFRFPNWDIPSQSYTFQNNGSLTLDGLISEVDGNIEPQFSPFWTAGTGHPSNNTHIYMRDDDRYVYVAADVLLDNTNEFGQDWIKIIAQNTLTGQEKEYRVDDYHDEYGRCAFGITSNVTYKHQTCEIRIPKSELTANKLDFVMRYYGTGGAGSIDIDQVVISDGSDTTPTLTGRARALDGAASLTQVTFGIYDNTTATTITSNYTGTCTADDGAFDEITELFSCTPSSALSYHHFRFYLRATNGSESDTITSDFFVHDSTFTTQENTDGFGDVNNSGIYAMAVFNSKLYAGTYNSTTGAEVWQYDGTTWTQSNADGFGDDGNVGVYSLTTYNSKLYATTENLSGAEVWEFNGSSWTQSNTDGFGEGVAIDTGFTSESYNSKLYVGTNGANGGEVWEYNGSSWIQSNTDGFGSVDNTDITSLYAFDGNLYAGTYNETTGAQVWIFNGSSWSLGEDEGITSSIIHGISTMAEFDDLLYLGTDPNDSFRGELLTGSNTTWSQVGTSGFSNGQGTSGAFESILAYNDRLYISIEHQNSPDSGAEVWSTPDGVSWILHTKGFGDSTNYRVDSLIQFQGKLLAGAYNGSTGAEVWSLNTDSAAPSLSLTAVTDPTSDTTPVLTGTATDAIEALVTDVEFQMDSTGGSWSNCTADDGTFDESTEAFTCTVTVALSAGSHTMYVRSTDSNDNTSGSGDESEDAFTVSASPTATPTPTIAPSSNEEDEDASESETPQIPQGQSEEIGGNFTPIKDSYTGGQSATVIVEPGTFSNDAYFSAQLSESQFSSGLLSNPLAGELNPDLGIFPTNIVLAGGIGGKLGIKQACGIAWQIGGVQQMWYKTYPPEGSNKPAAIIIPELQTKPSIIALSYKDTDLTPPGRVSQRFAESQLKLAHSIEGAVWRIMPTSVVDPVNNTVAALEKLGGYYMIVASCGGTTARTFSPSTLGDTTINDDVTPVEKVTSPVIKNESMPKSAQPVVKTESFFQKVTKVVRKIFNLQ